MAVDNARTDTYSCHSPYNLVLPMGIEPTSMRFRDACITTMLRKQFQQIVYLLFYLSGNIETHLDCLLGCLF